eukprot:GHVT01018814.1.p1 GENE.GHVT01018814.1~~GHVT01018814.1.p1  ORF type:complete len:316 (-),score=21.65 GHVT01018814.1:5805-6725(-)
MGQEDDRSTMCDEISSQFGEPDGVPASRHGMENVDWLVEYRSTSLPSIPPLTTDQKCAAVLEAFLCMERRHRIDQQLMVVAFEQASNVRPATDITKALGTVETYYPLRLMRQVDGEVIQDLLGDLAGAVEQELQNAENEQRASRSVYGLFCNVRVLGLVANKYGNVTNFSIFDPCPHELENRPASIITFRSLENACEWISTTFEKDPDVMGSSSKFRAWVMLSRGLWQLPLGGKSPEYARTPEVVSECATDDERQRTDPKYNAKVVYTRMHTVTTKPMHGESVFAMDPIGGLQVFHLDKVSQSMND